jgi:hypothetical protein
MKRLISSILASAFLCFGCEATVVDSPDDTDETDAAEQASDGEDGGECAAAPRGENETCMSDCDCAEGLKCSPCVNTEADSCLDYCHFDDPLCNYGIVTCPTGPGQACPAVRLCQ